MEQLPVQGRWVTVSDCALKTPCSVLWVGVVQTLEAHFILKLYLFFLLEQVPQHGGLCPAPVLCVSLSFHFLRNLMGRRWFSRLLPASVQGHAVAIMSWEGLSGQSVGAAADCLCCGGDDQRMTSKEHRQAQVDMRRLWISNLRWAAALALGPCLRW